MGAVLEGLPEYLHLKLDSLARQRRKWHTQADHE
jgi:hypothetical protein